MGQNDFTNQQNQKMSVGKKLLFDFTSSELQSEAECSIGYNEEGIKEVLKRRD